MEIDAEQFVGFNLERKCFLHTTMYDAVTKEQLPGVRVELSLLEDEDQNVIDPPKVRMAHPEKVEKCFKPGCAAGDGGALICICMCDCFHPGEVWMYACMIDK
eukprot:scaffold40553_cov22-Prasinocladus_malaysianus.AAC.1